MKRLFSVSVLLLLGLTPSASIADDLKATHGNICQPWGSADVPRVQYWDTGVEIAGAPAILSCPLTRDTTGTSGTMNSVAVEYFQAPGSQELWCDLVAQEEDGSLQDGSWLIWGFTMRSSASGYGQFSWNSITSFAGNEGSYNLTCGMEPGDKIFHIHQDED